MQLKDVYTDDPQGKCVNLAKLKLGFLESLFLRNFRVAWAKGEIYKRFGRQHKAVERSSALAAVAAPVQHC